jgi:hypothetical protein
MHLHLGGAAILAADVAIEGPTVAVAVHAAVGIAVVVGLSALFRWHGRHDRAAEKAYANGLAHHDEHGQLIKCGGCGRPSWDGNPVHKHLERCMLCLGQMAEAL